MTTNDIRSAYLDYFQQRGHHVLPSSSLLPENDPTTLFTGSGMQPMVPYLLGETHPSGTRLVDSQKCFRSGDIDEVGDNRHTTFFEMLGNWSLGDYFKKEQIEWMFDFLVHEIKLDPTRLYVTCFRGMEDIGIPKDEEAAQMWQKLFEGKGIAAPIVDFPETNGMQGGRIFYYDEKKNWWSRAGVPENMPIGEPGGPDSEMFWDFGEERGLHEASAWKDEPCHVNCDCGRFMEIGNNVFMAYKKTDAGFVELEHKNIDFGGGLERIAAALNDDPDMFSIDIFIPAVHKLAELSAYQRQYQGNEHAYRVILDHIRAATFLIGDGVVPSNKDQGYFVRRLIRRSVLFAHQMNITEKVCSRIGETFIDTYSESYPNLHASRASILSELEKEENKFLQTLKQGMKKFEQLLEANTDNMITAKDAFDLHQSYGFPIELTEELAKERGLVVDRSGFDVALKAHQDLSRAGAEKKFKGGLADHSEQSVKYHTATHLLHIALRRVLGDHVEQKGSNITPERLRFDFSHPEKMTPEQLAEVENLVNAAIARDYPVSFEEMPVQTAYDKGVIGVFPERYDEVIKVYTIGDPAYPGHANPDDPTFSREICGGPHVEHTGVLGKFKISKEEASSAGIRRIKAVLE